MGEIRVSDLAIHSGESIWDDAVMLRLCRQLLEEAAKPEGLTVARRGRWANDTINTIIDHRLWAEGLINGDRPVKTKTTYHATSKGREALRERSAA